MTAASLMSHCLASTNVLAAGADLFTESKLQLSAGTDSCAPRLTGRASRLDSGAFTLLEGPDVERAVEAAPCDVLMLLPSIWHCSEQVFRLGTQRTKQEIGVNSTNTQYSGS